MMKSAMTAEQWGFVIPPDKDGIWGSGYLTVENKHRMAATCLHDQPFGFTREDVATLRDVAADTLYETSDDERDDLRDLADRIEALLPPKDT